MSFLPQIEFASKAEVDREQLTRLRDIVNYVSANSPFYKDAFSRAGLSSLDIRTLRDLAKFPFTTKDELYERNWDFLCVPKTNVAEYTSTSGTLGKPVTIALTVNDVERIAYNEAISFACADGAKGDLYQLMLTLDRQFMAGMAYYEGIRKIGAGLVRVGPGLPLLQWETIDRLRPTAVVGVPSFIVKLLDFADENNIQYNDKSIKKILCIGESIRDVDLQPNALARAITDRWNVQLFSTYASTEMQTAFTECRRGVGGHHHPELVYIELLDEKGHSVPDGEPGEVVMTTLGVEGMPLIRYKTGDITRAYAAKCECGRVTMRLGGIEGRKQQMIKFKGTTLYPPSIFNVLNSLDSVADYVVEVYHNTYKTDEIRIYVCARDIDQNVGMMQELQSRFQSSLRVVPEIVCSSKENLENLNGARRSHKISRFIDSR